jgi:cytochrome c556
MIRIFAALAAIAIGATVVHAQNLDAIKKRRDVMKAIATAGTVNFKMMKGELPFDLAKAQAGLKVYQDEAAKLPTLFPDDSKTGGNTDAAEKIWQAKGEFDAAVNTFLATAKTAAGAITDEASFKKEYPAVFRSCGGCHKDDGGFAPRLSESFKKLNQ